jgi:acyl-CoA synthetase (AMP-forming)/AMP-acid ligase II
VDVSTVPDVLIRDPAVLQYSSGSTGQPKGVVLRHEHLMSNCRVLTGHIGEEPDRVGLTWLPPHHDMGLLGTIVFALHEHFVQHPSRSTCARVLRPMTSCPNSTCRR